MAPSVVALRPDTAAGADQALAALDRYLGRCKLASNTVKAYHRQCLAYLNWIDQGIVRLSMSWVLWVVRTDCGCAGGRVRRW